jgi:hypothetical protein
MDCWIFWDSVGRLVKVGREESFVPWQANRPTTTRVKRKYKNRMVRLLRCF